MDFATPIGLILAIVGIIGGNVIEGGSPMALFNIPGLMIVFVGTIGAVMISQPRATMIGLPKFILKAFMGGKGHNSVATVDPFVMMADNARREGLFQATLGESLEFNARMIVTGVEDPPAGRRNRRVHCRFTDISRADRERSRSF